MTKNSFVVEVIFEKLKKMIKIADIRKNEK